MPIAVYGELAHKQGDLLAKSSELRDDKFESTSKYNPEKNEFGATQSAINSYLFTYTTSKANTPATYTSLGPVIIGDNIDVDSNGKISVAYASENDEGVVKVNINNTGLKVNHGNLTTSHANNTTYGVVRTGKNIFSYDGEILTYDFVTDTIYTSKKIPVAGTPLADLANKEGITYFDPSMNLTKIFFSLFAKELWGHITCTKGTPTAAIPQPSFTLSTSNIVEVGTQVTANAVTLSQASCSATDTIIRDFTYGYSTTNDNEVENKNRQINVKATITSLNSNYTMSRNINGTTDSATPNITFSQVTLGAKTFEAREGTNSVSVSITGTKFNAHYDAVPKYYVGSNFGNTSESYISTAYEAFDVQSNVPSNSLTRTFIGAYPVFSTLTAKDGGSIDKLSKLGLVNLNGNATVQVTMPDETDTQKHRFAIPANHTLLSLQMYDTASKQWSNYDVDTKFTLTNITQTIQGKQVNYKLYTRNDGTHGETDMKINIK